MKKNFIFLILAFIISFSCVDVVQAATGKLTITSNVNSVATNTKFNVYVTYTGDTLGSIALSTTFTNATCTLYAQAEGYTRNCTTSGCKIVFEDYESGYKSGTKLATFACTGTGNPAKFTASVINGDAWDINGENQVSVTSGSKTVTITNATTTTKKTTTTTKKVTTTTTTKKKTTTKSTTKGNTTTKKTTTTKIPTTTTRTTISTTKGNVVIPVPTTTTTTTEIITTSINHLPDDMKLSELKIVGYDIDFNKNNTGYQIKVGNNVDEVYVIATPVDNKNSVENTGVVNIEGLKSFKVRVYNEEVDQEVIYSIKIIRDKESTLDIIYNKIFKPLVSVAVIIFTLLLLGIYFSSKSASKMDKYEEKDEEDEVKYKDGQFVVKKPDVIDPDPHKRRIEFLKDPDTQISTDVPITTIQAKHVSINRKKKEVLEKKLSEVGIEEIPENEQQLTRVLIQLNKTNEVPDISEKAERNNIKISNPAKHKGNKPVTTKVKINVDNKKEDMINIKDILRETENKRPKISIKRDEDDAS